MEQEKQYSYPVEEGPVPEEIERMTNEAIALAATEERDLSSENDQEIVILHTLKNNGVLLSDSYDLYFPLMRAELKKKIVHKKSSEETHLEEARKLAALRGDEDVPEEEIFEARGMK